MKGFQKKEHAFTIVVKTCDTREGAELALLSAFAKRDPDNCEFHLRKKNPKPKSRNKVGTTVTAEWKTTH